MKFVTQKMQNNALMSQNSIVLIVTYKSYGVSQPIKVVMQKNIVLYYWSKFLVNKSEFFVPLVNNQNKEYNQMLWCSTMFSVFLEKNIKI